MRHPRRFTSLLILLTIAVIGIGLPQNLIYAAPNSPDDQLIAQLRSQSGGSMQIARHAETGKVRFLALDAQHPLPRAANLLANATPEQASRQFLTTYGSLFGLRDQAQELTLMRNEQLASNRFVRFQQSYKGIPVMAGELIVQTDKNRNIVSANGEALPDLNLSVQPRIDSAAAAQAAQAVVAKAYKVSRTDLHSTPPQLWIYNPALLGGPGLRRSTLVWRTEVTAPASAVPVRELVLVDAQSGAIALHFNQIADAKERHVCNDQNKVDADEDPDNNCTADKYVRNEGDGPSNIADVDLAYDYAGVTYDFYRNNFGRDSLDGKGLPLISLVRYCPDSDHCPYKNAFWDGRQMVYGDTFASADDVVGHELSHGFTEFTSHLFYYYQSGAINESLSDVFGELIDQSDGVGNDTPAVRWELGEDLPASVGVVRDMRDPTRFDNPDRTSSVDYSGDTDDNGGVHTNSGVNNKAAYLMTDGDTFNGVTVSGIGLQKTAAVYYTVEVAFLTSGSDYQDLYTDLQAACATLTSTGAYGMTTADCAQVKLAGDATEMNTTPENAPVPEAAVCASGQTSNDLFYDDLENTQSGNWASAPTNPTLSTINAWYYPASNNPYDFDATYATSGVGNFWGYDYSPSSSSIDEDGPVGDYNIAMTRDVAIPANAFFHFRHAFEFENSFGDNYDGGVVEYSTDAGASWTDAGSLFNASGGANGYNVELVSESNNPLAGHKAFGNISQGYYSSRADLSSLAGQHVRFRFRIGTDETTGLYGWFIDDIRVYTCSSTPPTASLKLAAQNFTETSGSATVEVALSGVTDQDVAIPFTAGGTATLGEDYTLPSNVIIVPKGQASGKIVIPIIADAVDDPDETIAITLGTPTAASLGAITAETITITDGSKFKLFLPTIRK